MVKTQTRAVKSEVRLISLASGIKYICRKEYLSLALYIGLCLIFSALPVLEASAWRSLSLLVQDAEGS